MMSAPIGSMPNVSGSSIAMVAIGPTPGSTPTSVPTMQPMKHKPRFFQVSATEKPSPRLPMISSTSHLPYFKMTSSGQGSAVGHIGIGSRRA